MATKKLQVYKCEICGNIVEVLHEGAGALVCCGKPMVLYEENTKDAAQEKHVPVLEEKDGGILVTVGSVEHPMTEEHLIEWIELINEECAYVERKMLKSSDRPQAFFEIPEGCDKTKFYARAYCNLHGLWKKEV